MFADITLESANVPESRKRGLEQNRGKRADMYCRHCNKTGVDIAVNQESGTFLRNEVDDRPGLRTASAPPNDRRPGRTLGNLQTYRRGLRVKALTSIASKRTGKGGALHQTEVTYSIPADTTPATLTVIGIHAQTRRADPLGRSRRRLNRKLVERSEELHAAGVLHVIAGDANDGKRSWARQFRHLKVAAHRKVDWILVSREIEVRGSAVHRLPRVSDHAFITAEISVPIKSL